MAHATGPDGEMEIETVTSADGTEIAYERSGRGPPLVLVHGAIFDRGIWELGGVRSTLAEETTVYAIDRRNHGDSASADDVTPEAQFADVVAVVESIDEPVHLLGHSAGAIFALGAAPRTDNLRSLILHEPGIPAEEEVHALRETVGEMVALLEEGANERALVLFLDDFAQFAPAELDALRSAPVWDAHVETFPQTLLPLLEAGMGYELDFRQFEDLTTPKLLLTGSESGWLEDTAQRLHDTLPNSRLATFEGHGHGAHIAAPDRYTDEVLAFVADVD